MAAAAKARSAALVAAAAAAAAEREAAEAMGETAGFVAAKWQEIPYTRSLTLTLPTDY